MVKETRRAWRVRFPHVMTGRHRTSFQRRKRRIPQFKPVSLEQIQTLYLSAKTGPFLSQPSHTHDVKDDSRHRLSAAESRRAKRKTNREQADRPVLVGNLVMRSVGDLKPHGQNAYSKAAEDSNPKSFSDNDLPTDPMEALATKAEVTIVHFEISSLTDKFDMIFELVEHAHTKNT
ncbi:hypothetical protein M9H77_30736 [Catharanthus roseus]|uniref:Uncharacterized protein n=1 Tax=Catharanthus roseus TaxID=4058 RepID=A0ACC0A045_CATRO|nr:hypothetical protein M9H77_30736 [Catharanthus roseus]